MEYLLALPEDGLCFRIDHALGICHLCIIDRDAALLYQPACFAVGRCQSAAYHQRQNADAAVCEIFRLQNSGRHIGIVSAAAEYCLRSSLCLFGFFLAVHQLCQLVCQQILRLVQLLAFQCAFHLFNLFNGHKGEQLQGLGPTLPAFLSPNVLDYLVKNFGIAPITTPEEDLKAILG